MKLYKKCNDYQNIFHVKHFPEFLLSPDHNFTGKRIYLCFSDVNWESFQFVSICLPLLPSLSPQHIQGSQCTVVFGGHMDI